MSKEIGKKIVKNSVFSVLRGAMQLPITILITPLIIAKIGIEGFGVWALLSVITSYVGLVDLGISSALTKYVAEEKAKNNFNEINNLLNTSWLIYLLSGILALTLLVISKGTLISLLFRIEGGIKKDLDFVLIASVSIFILNLIFSIYPSLLNGFQRMDITNKIGIFSDYLTATGIVLVLITGYGLKEMIITQGMVVFLSITISYYNSRKLFNELYFNPLKAKKETVRKLFGYSLKIQISALAHLFHMHIDKLILSYFLGLKYVTFYEIASRLTDILRKIPLTIISPIMPAASELSASKNIKDIENLFQRSLKYLTLIAIPVFAFGLVFSAEILNIWLGKSYALSIWTMKYLCVAYFINILSAPGFYILNGIGKPEYGMISSLIAAILNSALSVLLVWYYGYYGAIYGTVLSMVIASLYFIIISQSVLKVHMIKALNNAVLIPVSVSTLLLALFFSISRQIGGVNFTILLIFFISYIAFFIVLMIKTHYINHEDVRLINQFLPSYLRLSSIKEGERGKKLIL